MSNNASDKAAQEHHFADIFARLREQDIEQFYAHYQLWVLRRRVPLVEKQIEALREHLAENQQSMEALHPSALALAVLVRLQSNGVSDTDVLDLMLNRGEDWLDRMMQRLDYCEQVEDFIQGDYTQWCVKSLEGAYDWIDSLLGSIKEDTRSQDNAGNEIVATEELLLQKLSLDDDEATLTQFAELHKNAAETGLEAGTQTTSASQFEPEHLESTEAFSEQEQILASSEMAEQQTDNAIEEAPELIGWKDLEDLEAPEGQPVPWYSVNVTENGASAINTDAAEHASPMDDWIKVLRAEDVHPTETGETAVVASSSPEYPIDEAETAESASAQNAIPLDEVLVEETGNSADNTGEAVTSAESIEVENEEGTGEKVLVIEELEFAEAEQEADTSESPEEIGTDEATPGLDEQSAIGEARIPATDAAISTDGPDLYLETQTAEHAQETSHEEPSNEVETAAMLNDLLSLEGEQEEQLAWYEYLESEEPASPIAPDATDERGESEESRDTSPDETSAGEAGAAPEIYEQVVVEEQTDEPDSTFQSASSGTEETSELEGWQSWNTNEADDETIPLALKEIQLARQDQSNDAQEYSAPEVAEAQAATVVEAEIESSLPGADGEEGSAGEPVDVPGDEESAGELVSTTAEEPDAELEVDTASSLLENVALSALAPNDLPEISSSPVAQNESAPFVAAEANMDADNLDQPEHEPVDAQLIQAEPEEAGEILIESATILEHQQSVNSVETVTEQARTREPDQIAPPAQAATSRGTAPKKPGFWRRLFSFGRKNRR